MKIKIVKKQKKWLQKLANPQKKFCLLPQFVNGELIWLERLYVYPGGIVVDVENPTNWDHIKRRMVGSWDDMNYYEQLATEIKDIYIEYLGKNVYGDEMISLVSGWIKTLDGVES